MTNIEFEIIDYSVMMGQYVPVPHVYYKDLPVQGIIECFGKGGRRYQEKMTIYFLPDQLSPTKPLSSIYKYGGVIFVNFKDILKYLDILRNESKVYAIVNEDEPSFNRLYTKTTKIKKKAKKIIKK